MFRFQKEVEIFLRSTFSVELAAVSNHDLDQLIKLGLFKAESYDFYSLYDKQIYLGNMIVLGCHFDLDCQLPWIGSLLKNPRFDNSHDKAAFMAQETLAYLVRVFGESNGFLQAALKNFLNMPQLPSPELEPQSIDSYLTQQLFKLFPEKALALGVDNLRGLVWVGVEKSYRYGLRQPSSAAFMVILIFFLGGHFDEDPLHKPFEAVLTKHSMKESIRVKALRTIGVKYAQNVLSMVGYGQGYIDFLQKTLEEGKNI